MTSGASEMIFVNCRSRSSRATGPKMRVPTGLSSTLISTTALRSKRMYEPSLRPTSLTVRTTTARATSPFFTVPSGTASLMATITMSPREAVRLLEPPSTRMHCAFLAPELSATSSMDLGWIMAGSPASRAHAGQDLTDAPPLVLRQGPRLLDQDPVPVLARVGLVVGLQPLRPRDDPLVTGMTVDALDSDHAGPGHLVAHHHAFFRLRLSHADSLPVSSRSAARARGEWSWPAPDPAWPAARARGSWRRPWRAETGG